MILAGGALVAGYFVQVQDAAAESRDFAETAPVAAKSPELDGVRAAVGTFLEGHVELTIDDRAVSVAWTDLGLGLDPTSIGRAQLAGDRFAGFVPVSIDREKAAQALEALKQTHDRAPANAYMDLEARTVHADVPGWGLDIYESISVIEAAARRGHTEVALEGAEIPAEIGKKDLGIEDISTVISTFTTKFSVAEKSRNSNLKLLATHLDGRVLQPGEPFSFNETTGDRTEKEGYKMAHVISQGEMVDGMAGGSCQISTTLHGAAFFAGLEIVGATPHSRPSTYVTMGLDATVVYPELDLQLENPFDFPVVIHFKVARGEATVEILGKEKPFDKIAFEATVNKRIPFDTLTREDDNIAIGNMVIDQPGYPGYRVTRRRIYYKGDDEVKRDTWNIRYSPVVEYVRMGVNPNPNLPPPKQKKAHGPRPAGGTRRIEQ